MLFYFRRFIYVYLLFTCYQLAYFTSGAIPLPLLLKVSTAFELFIIALLIAYRIESPAARCYPRFESPVVIEA